MAHGICPIGNHPFDYVPRGTEQLYCSPGHRERANTLRRKERNEALEGRLCPRCGTWKPTAEFASGLAPYCKPCTATFARDANREHARQDPAYTRILNLRRYGLTPETFAARLAAQGGRCAICRTDTPGTGGWHVDHDHTCCKRAKASCGKCLRGILCGHCNIGIGNLREDPAIIQAALNYVLAHRERLSHASDSWDSGPGG